jgi:hypothetical protein
VARAHVTSSGRDLLAWHEYPNYGGNAGRADLSVSFFYDPRSCDTVALSLGATGLNLQDNVTGQARREMADRWPSIQRSVPPAFDT